MHETIKESPSMEQWHEIEHLYKQYKATANEVIDYDKYHEYSIIAHSTAIEGGTLTESETQMLLEYGTTAGNKPLVHHLMTTDLKHAYQEVKVLLHEPFQISPKILQHLNAKVMSSTGRVYHQAVGSFDASRGEYRLCGANAGVGGRSYIHYQKIPQRVEMLCQEIMRVFPTLIELKDIYEFSFWVHLRLVEIHPWADGNGRTSRLLMNYIQMAKGVMPNFIYAEDKAYYIEALRRVDSEELDEPFISFMRGQLHKFLLAEIERTSRQNILDTTKDSPLHWR